MVYIVYINIYFSSLQSKCVKVQYYCMGVCVCTVGGIHYCICPRFQVMFFRPAFIIMAFGQDVISPA